MASLEKLDRRPLFAQGQRLQENFLMLLNEPAQACEFLSELQWEGRKRNRRLWRKEEGRRCTDSAVMQRKAWHLSAAQRGKDKQKQAEYGVEQVCCGPGYHRTRRQSVRCCLIQPCRTPKSCVWWTSSDAMSGSVGGGRLQGGGTHCPG